MPALNTNLEVEPDMQQSWASDDIDEVVVLGGLVREEYTESPLISLEPQDLDFLDALVGSSFTAHDYVSSVAGTIVNLTSSRGIYMPALNTNLEVEPEMQQSWASDDIDEVVVLGGLVREEYTESPLFSVEPQDDLDFLDALVGSSFTANEYVSSVAGTIVNPTSPRGIYMPALNTNLEVEPEMQQSWVWDDIDGVVALEALVGEEPVTPSSEEWTEGPLFSVEPQDLDFLNALVGSRFTANEYVSSVARTIVDPTSARPSAIPNSTTSSRSVSQRGLGPAYAAPRAAPVNPNSTLAPASFIPDSTFSPSPSPNRLLHPRIEKQPGTISTLTTTYGPQLQIAQGRVPLLENSSQALQLDLGESTSTSAVAAVQNGQEAEGAVIVPSSPREEQSNTSNTKTTPDQCQEPASPSNWWSWWCC
jgi:hypothetical protein